MTITAVKSRNRFKIKINGYVQLSFMGPVQTFKAWYDNATQHFIEVKNESQTVTVEYDTRDKWMTVITLFEKHKMI